MSENHRSNSRVRVLLIGIPGRAAATTFRPLTGMVGRAAAAGVIAERRAVDLLLESAELERVLNAAVDSVRIQASLERALDSDGVRRLVDRLFDSGLLDQVIDRMFDSGLFDRILERLLASEGLWHMIDEIAASPAVTAAISQQGLGFADQLGDEVRARSRKADDWVERAARRLMHRPPRVIPPEPDPGV